MNNKLIFPKSNLKAKSSEPGGMSPEEALKKGEQSIEQLKFEYEKWLHEDLKALDALLADFKAKPDAREETFKAIREKIHDVRSQGTTFGYALVSTVANSMCHLIVEAPNGEIPPFELLFIHVNSLHLVVDKNIEGTDNDGARTLLKSLDAMVSKYLTKPSSIKITES